MRKVNPIYDMVFKYLMEDRESEVLLLSEIIGKEIVELDFHPQESSAVRTGPIRGTEMKTLSHRIQRTEKMHDRST
ncbi:MAG: hypothetical protein D3916_10800 [Candidatus Electrothrix sp. MAN1_4]|nr:hypothetical protein [Candidatus Electrothrix sp. MAN1_4]